jgi:hypothetical protein
MHLACLAALGEKIQQTLKTVNQNNDIIPAFAGMTYE